MLAVTFLTKIKMMVNISDITMSLFYGTMIKLISLHSLYYSKSMRCLEAIKRHLF